MNLRRTNHGNRGGYPHRQEANTPGKFVLEKGEKKRVGTLYRDKGGAKEEGKSGHIAQGSGQNYLGGKGGAEREKENRLMGGKHVLRGTRHGRGTVSTESKKLKKHKKKKGQTRKDWAGNWFGKKGTPKEAKNGANTINEGVKKRCDNRRPLDNQDREGVIKKRHKQISGACAGVQTKET